MAESERELAVKEPPDAKQDRKKMQHKTTILVVLGALAVVVMIVVSRSRAAAQAGGSPAVYPASSPGYTGTLAGGASTSTDPYAESMLQQLVGQTQANQQAMAGWQQNLQGITAAVSDIENRLPALASSGPMSGVGAGPSGSPLPAVGGYSGSGFLPASPGQTSPGIAGGQYAYIGTGQQLTTDIQQFGPGSIYAQTNPGVFAPSQGPGVQQQFLPGTPQYLKVS